MGSGLRPVVIFLGGLYTGFALAERKRSCLGDARHVEINFSFNLIKQFGLSGGF